MTDEHKDTTTAAVAATATEPEMPDDPVKRRSFLQLMGGAALPLMAEGCVAEEGDPRAEPMHLRVLNDPMFSMSIDVHRAKKNQSILNEEEHMSVDNSLLAVLSLGDQVRVTRSADEYAIYTVADFRNETNESDARMGLRARNRLGTGSPFPATLSTAIAAVGLTDDEAQAQSELVEHLVDDGDNTGLCVIAPHGGWIELYTHLQAERVTTTLAAHGVSSWICQGYRQGGGAYSRWHITSTDLSPNSFAGLDAIANRGFAYCVSFHGMSGDGILVGGGASVLLRTQIRDEIAAALAGMGIDVYVATADDEFAGDSPNNVVNWLTAGGEGGVQIEQSLRAREDHWEAIADAVAAVFDAMLSSV